MLRDRLRRLLARSRSSPLVRRVASGAVWSILGTGLSRVLVLVAAILIARQLGAIAYGEYNLVQTTAGVFLVVAGFGLGATATKFLSGRYRSDPEAAGRVVALSAIVGVIVGAAATIAMVLASPWIARDLLRAPGLVRALRIGALILLFGSVNGAQFGILAGLERFRAIAVASAISGAISIPMLVAGARWGGMTGAVAGSVGAVAATTASYGAAVRAALRSAGIAPRYRSAFREWRILVAFSAPSTLSNLLVTVVTWVASAIIANQSHGFRELGLFAAANQWRNAQIMVANAASAVLFPVFSQLHDDGRARAFSRAFWTSLAAVGGACALGALAVSFASPALMRAYGAEFAGAARVLVLMLAAGAMAAPLSVVANAINGSGRMWLGFGLTAAWACVLVGATWALRDRGALGLAVAYVLSYAVHLAAALGGAFQVLRRSSALEAGAGASQAPAGSGRERAGRRVWGGSTSP